MTSDSEREVAAAKAAVDALPEHFFELYKLAVEMADRVSARRATANGFFLTINTGLVALVGGANLRWYVAAAGIVFSASWWLLLRSYRDLNDAKFSVITAMELRLPHRLYEDEQAHYSARGTQPAQVTSTKKIVAWSKKYRELGAIERHVPLIFGLIYVIEICRQVGL